LFRNVIIMTPDNQQSESGANPRTRQRTRGRLPGRHVFFAPHTVAAVDRAYPCGA